MACVSCCLWSAGAAHAGEDLTLDRVIAASLAHQPVMAAARAQRRAASEEQAAARHGLFPQLSLSAGEVFASTQDGIPDFVAANGARERSAQAVLDQGIYDPHRYAVLAAARAQAAFARFAALRTRLAVAQAAAQAFYALRRREASVQILQSALDQATQLLTDTRSGYAAGVRARLDLVRAQAQVSDAGAAVATARVERDTAAYLLSLMTGQNPLPSLAPPRPLSGDLSLPDEARLRETALAQRPELEMARADEALSRAGLADARAARAPRLSLQAAYGWDTLATPSRRNQGWMAGLSLRMPIFSWGRLQERESAARLKVRAAQAQRSAVELGIDAELKRAWGNAQAALTAFRASRQLVQQDADIYRMSQEGYNAGRMSSLDLALARSDWVQSELRQQQARFNLRLGLAELDLMTGALPAQGAEMP
ncbi:MAG: TolC family protein [Acidiferrobacterales bacterium]